MNRILFRGFLSISLFILIIVPGPISLDAQEAAYPYPALSPKGKILQTVGNTAIEIEYERPSARKRQVFGDLVPWNKVWRTGAGHCTKISVNKNVVVEGQKVRPGKYALLTIPNPEEWIIILNRDTSLYGTSSYDPAKDEVRFTVIPSSTSRFYETLNIDIELIPNDARIFISWADVQVSFQLETTTDPEMEEFIQSVLLSKNHDSSNIYAGAAEYLLYQGKDYSDALLLADYAIELDPNNGWARMLKIKIYERLKLYDKALQEINAAINQIKLNQSMIGENSQIELEAYQAESERIRKLRDHLE